MNEFPALRGLLLSAMIMLGSLVALTGLRQFFIEPLSTMAPNIVWFTIQLLPLLLPLPGLLRLSLKSTFVVCLASLLYFIHGVYVISDPELTLFGAFEIGFSLTLCGLTAWLVRKIREAQTA